MQNNLDNIKIGERIRSLRENLSMSRETFSEMIGISEVFLGQIERGESSLSLKTLINIVAFTGTSTDFILFGINDQNSYIKKINRMVNYFPDDEIIFIYKIIHNIYSFNKKLNEKSDDKKNNTNKSSN